MTKTQKNQQKRVQADVVREAAAAQGPQPKPSEIRPTHRLSFRPMQNDCEAGGLNVPPQAKLTTPRLVVKEPTGTSVHHELEAQIRALEAMIWRDIDASGKRDRRLPKEREAEVSTTPLVEETGGVGGKKPRTDDDLAEIGPTRACQRSY